MVTPNGESASATAFTTHGGAPIAPPSPTPLKPPGPGLGVSMCLPLLEAMQPLAALADTAQLGTTEIQVGLWPMMITAEITRNVGRKRTLEMMLTGRKLSAEEAREAYASRLVQHRQAMREMARIYGFMLIAHRTDHSAAPALSLLTASLSERG